MFRLPEDNVVPMPLFQQVKETIRGRILDGSFAPHSKLPSERELTESFKVSRITIRQALSELQQEGLIFKINGKGTFVSKPKASFDVSKLRGFGESAASIGQEFFSRMIAISTEAATPRLMQKLKVNGETPVTRIQRIRYLNREPLAFDITHAAGSLGQKLATADLEKRDILEILENDCSVSIESAEVNLEALLADEKLSGHLAIECGSPILHIERCILDRQKQPILYENLYYRGDNFRFGMHVERAHLNE